MKASNVFAAAGMGGAIIGATARPTDSSNREVGGHLEGTAATRIGRRTSIAPVKTAGYGNDDSRSQASGQDSNIISIRATPNQRARSASTMSKGSQFSRRPNWRDERFRSDSKCSETGRYDNLLNRCVQQYDIDAEKYITHLEQANEKGHTDYEKLSKTHKTMAKMAIVSSGIMLAQSGVILAPLVRSYVADRRQVRAAPLDVRRLSA